MLTQDKIKDVAWQGAEVNLTQYPIHTGQQRNHKAWRDVYIYKPIGLFYL